MVQTLLGASLSKRSVPDPASGKQLQISEPGVCRAEREKTQLYEFKELILFHLGEIPLNLPLWIEMF